MATEARYRIIFCLSDNSQFPVGPLTLAEYTALVGKVNSSDAFIFTGTVSTNGQLLLNGTAIQRSAIVRYNVVESQETVK